MGYLPVLDFDTPLHANTHLSDGVDPTLKRRAEEDAATNTFKAVADEWLMTKKHALTPATWVRDKPQIYKWVVPYLGSKPIASTEAPDLLAVLEKIEALDDSGTCFPLSAVADGRSARTR